MKISDIQVGKRHRKDMGDIRGLANSIEARGLLQPVAVRPDGTLVAGERRLRAMSLLGRDEAPAVVVDNLGDALALLRAERDENTERKDFTPSEAVALGREIEGWEEKEAKRRQGTRMDLPQHSGKLPEGSAGDTRDKVGAAVGLSGKTYERAKEIVEAAEQEPEKFSSLLEKMDRTGRVNGVHRQLKVIQQTEKITKEPPPMSKGPFRVIVVDPPWSYDKRTEDPTHRTACPYPGMSIKEIEALPVGEMAGPDSILWLWTTNAHMPHAFGIVEAWGFEFKTVLTWEKDRMGTGDWLRGQTEHCLMAVRGNPIVTLTNQTTVIHGPRREHSRKPDSFYELVESLCPGSKAELFGRTEREGWITHGDETTRFQRIRSVG